MANKEKIKQQTKTYIIMKKQFLAILFIACLTSVKSQVYFAGSFGAGTTGKALAGAATIGLDVHRFLFQTGFHTHLSQKSPTIYRLAAGRSFEVGEMANLNLTGGVCSMDSYYSKGQLMTQEGTWIASVEYAKDFQGKGEYFFEMTQAGKRFNFITVGLKYFFVGGKQKTGCPSTWVR